MNVTKLLLAAALAATSMPAAAQQIVGHDRNATGDRVELLLDHLAERFAVPAHGTKKDDEILHRSTQGDTDQNPDRAWKVAELSGQDGPDKRSGAGNRREMMTEDNPLVGLNEIAAVILDLAWGGAAVI